MYDKILALVKENGPMLPVEIASKTDMNSFLAKAYMEELAKQEKLKVGGKVGDTPLFMLPGQESQAEKRAEELSGQARTVAGHVGKGAGASPEARKKQEEFKKHFEKTINEPEPAPKPKSKPQPSSPAPNASKSSPGTSKQDTGKLKERVKRLFVKREEPKKMLKSSTSAAKTSGPSTSSKSSKTSKGSKSKKSGGTKSKKSSKTKSKSPGGDYISKVREMFESGQAKLVEVVTAKKKRGKFIVDFPSSIGAIRYFVVVRDKKRISKSDVALAYTEATNRKLPALLITGGKMAGTAKDYAEELGGLFKYKVVK